MAKADLQYEDTLKRSELRKFPNSVKVGQEPQNKMIYSYRQDSWVIMETMSNVDVKALYVTLSMAQLFTLQT